jgi:phosphoenolpyruvate carboxylase
VSVEGLKALIQHFADAGLAARARALSALHGDGLSGAAQAQVRVRLEAQASKGFDAFAAAVTRRRGGVVFTAHPTFALSRAVRDALAHAAVTGEADALVGAGHVHGPDADVTLINEHDEAMAAVEAAREALTGLNALVLDVARTAFPDRWHSLDPDLISLASWVGYDLDGRTDIHWGRSIAFRLQEKTRQLMRYAALIEASGAAELVPLAARQRAAGEAAYKRHLDVVAGLTTPIEAARAQAFSMITRMRRRRDPLAERVGRSLARCLENASALGRKEAEITALHRATLAKLEALHGAPGEVRAEIVDSLERLTARRHAA